MDWDGFGNFKVRRRGITEEKEILQMSANCEKIPFFNSFEILVGKLLDPVDLFSFNFKITILDSFTICCFNEKVNQQ